MTQRTHSLIYYTRNTTNPRNTATRGLSSIQHYHISNQFEVELTHIAQKLTVKIELHKTKRPDPTHAPFEPQLDTHTRLAETHP